MFQQVISKGVENVGDVYFRKNVTSVKSKGLKQRSKALSDVKNTIHSHASNLVEKNKNGDKKKRNSAVAFSKGTNKLFNVLEEENVVKFDGDMPEPEIECMHRCMYDKTNNLDLSDFLNEYRLTEKELSCFSNKMNFFRFDPPTFEINALSPVEDVELNLAKITLAHDEDLIDDVIEVPEPSFF